MFLKLSRFSSASSEKKRICFALGPFVVNIEGWQVLTVSKLVTHNIYGLTC